MRSYNQMLRFLFQRRDYKYSFGVHEQRHLGRCSQENKKDSRGDAGNDHISNSQRSGVLTKSKKNSS